VSGREETEIKEVKGFVCWITGLSGAGKSTLGEEVVLGLKDNGLKPIFLDGDDLRSVLGISSTDFSRAERLRLAFVYADLCRYIASQGAVVVIATIALFKEIHDWNRSNLPNYFEVFLDIPLTELEERDSKGLYEKYRKGEIHNVAGLDFEVDFPSNPDLIIGVEAQNRQVIVSEIINRILGSQVESV
jgi:adenylylsulfate kinase-like enzyme